MSSMQLFSRRQKTLSIKIGKWDIYRITHYPEDNPPLNCSFSGSWPAYSCLWSSYTGFGQRQLLRTRCTWIAWRWNAVLCSQATSHQLYLSGFSCRWIASKWRVTHPVSWYIWKRTWLGSFLFAKHWKQVSGFSEFSKYSLVARDGFPDAETGTSQGLATFWLCPASCGRVMRPADVTDSEVFHLKAHRQPQVNHNCLCDEHDMQRSTWPKFLALK